MEIPQSDYDDTPSARQLDLTDYIIKNQAQYVDGGSFGDVYKCQLDGSTGTVQVAIKALRFQFTLEGDGIDSSSKIFRRELDIWRKMNHVNIVPFLGVAHGFGMRNSTSLVSLWMPNGSLQSFLADFGGCLITAHRLQLLMNVADGLHYLHSLLAQPIVHGDLNSNNVLIDGDYTARITDFGYPSLIGASPELLDYLRRSAMRPGSFRWITPEQVHCNSKEGFRKTTNSDVYTFGLLVLQVLSGKQPWSEIHEDASVVLCLAQGRQPERPKSLSIDDQHWELMNKCWSSAPEQRPSAGIIVSTIQQFLNRYSQAPPIHDVITSFSRQNPPRCVQWAYSDMRNTAISDYHRSEVIQEYARTPRWLGSWCTLPIKFLPTVKFQEGPKRDRWWRKKF